jgi:nucleoid DNA-binding protein
MYISKEEIASQIAEKHNLAPEEVIKLVEHFEKNVEKQLKIKQDASIKDYIGNRMFTKFKVFIPNFGSFVFNKPNSRTLNFLIANNL